VDDAESTPAEEQPLVMGIELHDVLGYIDALLALRDQRPATLAAVAAGQWTLTATCRKWSPEDYRVMADALKTAARCVLHFGGIEHETKVHTAAGLVNKVRSAQPERSSGVYGGRALPGADGLTRAIATQVYASVAAPVNSTSIRKAVESARDLIVPQGMDPLNDPRLVSALSGLGDATRQILVTFPTVVPEMHAAMDPRIAVLWDAVVDRASLARDATTERILQEHERAERLGLLKVFGPSTPLRRIMVTGASDAELRKYLLETSVEKRRAEG